MKSYRSRHVRAQLCRSYIDSRSRSPSDPAAPPPDVDGPQQHPHEHPRQRQTRRVGRPRRRHVGGRRTARPSGRSASGRSTSVSVGVTCLSRPRARVWARHTVLAVSLFARVTWRAARVRRRCSRRRAPSTTRTPSSLLRRNLAGCKSEFWTSMRGKVHAAIWPEARGQGGRGEHGERTQQERARARGGARGRARGRARGSGARLSAREGA